LDINRVAKCDALRVFHHHSTIERAVFMVRKCGKSLTRTKEAILMVHGKTYWDRMKDEAMSGLREIENS
jgi:hypothetical protein